MDVDDAGRSRQNAQKQGQLKQGGQDKKATKSDDQVPSARKKPAKDSDDDSSVVGDPKNKFSTKKNSALLNDQFKNLEKSKANDDKAVNELNPFIMDSDHTNAN